MNTPPYGDLALWHIARATAAYGYSDTDDIKEEPKQKVKSKRQKHTLCGHGMLEKS